MTPAQIADAAALLLEARRTKRRVPRLPDDLAPSTTEHAEAICEAMGHGMETPTGGWKVGGTDPDLPTKRGLKKPFCGRVPAKYLLEDGAEVAWADLMRPVVEGEIAFRLGADLPSRSRPYSEHEIDQAIDAVLPAIEIPEARLTDDHPHGGLGMVADQGYAGRLVLGRAVSEWGRLDLRQIECVLTISGQEVSRGVGTRAMGNPINAVYWLTDRRSTIGDGLKAGQVISTGSLTGIQWTKSGDRVTADFGPLGRVALSML